MALVHGKRFGALLPVVAILTGHAALANLARPPQAPRPSPPYFLVRPALFDFYDLDGSAEAEGCLTGEASDRDRTSSCRVWGYATCEPNAEGVPDEEWAVWRFEAVEGTPYRLEITWLAEVYATAPSVFDEGIDNFAEANVLVEVSLDGGETMHQIYAEAVQAGGGVEEQSTAGKAKVTKAISLRNVKDMEDVVVYVSSFAEAPACDSGRAVGSSYVELFDIRAKIIE